MVNVLINRALDGCCACYLSYDSAANILVLLFDIRSDATLLPLPGTFTGSHAVSILPANPLALTAAGSNTFRSGDNGAADGATSIRNSQCIQFATGSAFQDNGHPLILELQIQFKFTFTGRWLLYGGAQTAAAANSGWHVLGAIRVE